MGELEKFLLWGYKCGIKDIRKRIQKNIKNGRLVFLNRERILFTYKDGQREEMPYYMMAKKAMELGDWKKNMVTLGITENDIVNILMEEYEKQRR